MTDPATPARVLLKRLFETAVAAAHPAECLPPHLPPPPEGKLILLAAGKAAGAMAETAEAHYREAGVAPDRLTGLAVTRHGYARPTQNIPVIEAGHPVPDQASIEAATRVLAFADAAGADDLVLALISGGASANWVAPAEGLTLAEKQAVSRALLKSGASIGEINTVRKHLSRIKGGRLAQHAGPARVVTLAISDVPGDDPAVIGSGPTVPDPTTLAQARAIVARYGLSLPASILRALDDAANETPKANHPAFRNASFQLVARPADSFEAAGKVIRDAGYDYVFLGDRVEGEAREVAAAQARLARDLQRQGRRAVIVSGGELTVTIRGPGRGGPNQEFALALALELSGTHGIAALAGDTDGTDGGSGSASDPAGAHADGTTVSRARENGLDAAASLANNDSTTFFETLGDLLAPGPTFTNVNDFRAIVVDTP
ncbi:MAG: glycerate kinase [Pseudorhodoplanes sp.]